MATAIFWFAIYLRSTVNPCPTRFADAHTAFTLAVCTTSRWARHRGLAVVTHPARATIAASSQTAPMPSTCQRRVRVGRIGNFTFAANWNGAIITIPCNVALAFSVVTEPIPRAVILALLTTLAGISVMSRCAKASAVQT